ncbi:MAG: peroxiredoxin family protein [Candidatus Methylomirabilia bacterium]
MLLLTVVHLVGFTAPAVSGSPGPFETLGLIRFDSGIKAPHFTLPDLNGNSVSLASPPGSATLLVFWGTW